jgi:hypothetical protein
LPEKAVTLKCILLSLRRIKALMVDENAQFNFNKQRAYFGKDNNIPLREMPACAEHGRQVLNDSSFRPD